jgi:hypothetical protein
MARARSDAMELQQRLPVGKPVGGVSRKKRLDHRDDGLTSAFEEHLLQATPRK